ncbi:MAG TPA: UTP--glucose-1-phosphate uridylyltransferase GalU [Burkholderiaceae bacterium]|nr:UTP--glucose-1-phosphate uridylyltransferase GalU [Burkholderiaceae bacterium]
MNDSPRPVRKAVFPVAGLGTRFLPATKAMPKEMLPVVDKPLIQYAVEEAVAAGITELVFITGRNKRAIEDHFDAAPELEAELEAKNKTELLATVRNILPRGVTCVYIRQPAPNGLGAAVLCAQPVVGDEPFAVLLADDLIDAEVSVTRQLVKQYESHHASVLGAMTVPREDTSKYGIVATETIDAATGRVTHIVEKPDPKDAPSTLAVVGRYVLEPQIFTELRNTRPGKNGEIQLTDGIAALLRSRRVVAHCYSGTRYDCGSKQGFVAATLALGQRRIASGDLD